jgi:hypothetical protein
MALVRRVADQKTTARILTDFTRAHDALEAAIMKGSPEAEIAARRNDCLALLDRLATRH